MTDQEIRSQLWDYIYGLLESDEAAALEVRIKSEPRLARWYAETRLEADLLAGAARWEHAPIPLTTKIAPAVTAASTTRGTPTLPKAARRQQPPRWASPVSGLAAALLLGLFLYAWRSVPSTITAETPQPIQDAAARRALGERIAERQIIAEVRGPANLPAGLTNRFMFETTDSNNAPLAANLTCRMIDEEGKTEYFQEFSTNERGWAELEIPGKALHAGAELVVEGGDGTNNTMPPVRTKLAVAQEEYLAYLEVDRSVVQPGEPLFYRSVVRGKNSQAERDQAEAEFFLLDPRGETVPGSRSTDVTSHGVAAGEAVIPSNAVEGRYEVLVRSPRGEFKEERLAIVVQRGVNPIPNAAAFAGSATTQAGGKVALSDASMNGRPVEKQLAELKRDARPNRYERKEVLEAEEPTRRTSRSADKPASAAPQAAPHAERTDGAEAKPAEPMLAPPPAVVAAAPVLSGPATPAPAVSGPSTPALENAPATVGPPAERGVNQADGGRGRTTPSAKAADNAPTAAAPAGPATFGMAERVAKKAEQAHDSADDSEAGNRFQVTPDEAGLKLRVPAEDQFRRLQVQIDKAGEVIAQSELSSTNDGLETDGAKEKGSRSRSKVVAVPLPPEIEGNLGFAVHDAAAVDPQPLFQGKFYRAPRQKLELLLDEPAETYAPGEEVTLQLAATTEAGEQVTAVLGVRVVNDDNLAAPVADRTSADRAAGTYYDVEVFDNSQPSGRPSAEGVKLKEAAGDRFANQSRPFSEPASEAAPQAGAPGEELKKVLQQQPPTDTEVLSAESPGEAAPTHVTLGSNRSQMLRADALPKSDMQLESKQAHAARPSSVMMCSDNRPMARRLLLGGLLGLVGIGGMLVMGVSLKVWAWGPAAAAAIACLVLGMIRLAPPECVTVATAEFNRRQMEIQQPTDGLKRVESPDFMPNLTPAAPSETAPADEDGDQAPARDSLGLQNAEREQLTRAAADARAAAPLPGKPADKSTAAIGRRSLAYDPQIGGTSAPQEGKREQFPERLGGELSPGTAPFGGAGGVGGGGRGGVDEAGKKRPPMQAAAKDGGQATVPLAEAPAEPPASVRLMKRQAAGGFGGPAVPPATLLWNPRLITDDLGQARIQFRLPEQPGRFRVQIHAHSGGRLGTVETVISTLPSNAATPPDAAAVPAEPADEPAPAKPPLPSEAKE